MKVPVGFLARLWSFLSFLPFFLMLLILGILKAAIIGPLAAAVVMVGNSTVVIGLWPAHFLWTYFCVAKTRRLGLVMKIVVLLILPVPMLTWPIFAMLGSSLFGLGYGFFAPLIATFEAVGEEVIEKLYHCFADGCRSTVEGACTAVRDFTDFCFHSYFSYMDEFSEKVPEGEKPFNIELSKLPGCLLVCILSVITDVPVMTILALCKSPYMLLKGWRRLFEDLIGREGPFLETVCVPFAGLAIILWPIAVTGAVICAFLCSFFLGFYSAVVVCQEDSLQMGLIYLISVISMFDEYTNDLLYLRDGSCFPRPEYRKKRQNQHVDQDKIESKSTKSGPAHTKLISERSRTLTVAFQRLKPIQIWDWLFRSCELNGRILLRDGLINVSDIADCILQGRCKKLTIKLPAWCILQCLLRSAKSDSYGLLLANGVELTDFNWPKDKVSEWFLGPLLIMKEQIKRFQLSEAEEACLEKLIMIYDIEKPEDWYDSGFPSDDNVRRAQLQAVFRRLQGMVSSLSRLPTFRRRFHNLVRVLYLESLETGALTQERGESSKSVQKSNSSKNAHRSLERSGSGIV